MNKLVRDKVVRKIEKDGTQKAIYKTLTSKKDQGVALYSLLREELQQLEECFKQAKHRDVVLDSIAEVITILESLSRNVLHGNIATIIEKKQEELGGYDRFIYLEDIKDEQKKAD